MENEKLLRPGPEIVQRLEGTIAEPHVSFVALVDVEVPAGFGEAARAHGDVTVVTEAAAICRIPRNDRLLLEKRETDFAEDIVRYQYVGAFYPWGAVIALQSHLGRLMLETYLNIQDRDDEAVLDRLRRQGELWYYFFEKSDGRWPCVLSRGFPHSALVVEELGALVARAKGHRAKRFNWEKAVAQYSVDTSWF
jgi:hypothetical protein